jgi:hypothetical protein
LNCWALHFLDSAAQSVMAMHSQTDGQGMIRKGVQQFSEKIRA